MIISRLLLTTAFSLLATLASIGAPRMENLSRGVVAIHDGGKVFVSWRLLGTEAPKTGFQVYRAAGGGAPTKINETEITDVTFFIDERPNLAQESSYTIRAVIDGREQPESKPFKLAANAPARPYLSLPLQTPERYRPNDASVGDLDGDGDYEIVLHQTGRAKDNSQAGETDPPILQAYKLDGTLLWSINLGRNIREGAHYTQFMVYDLDGDGRAEIACKTADGTVDGTGKVIGDPNANHRNARGFVLAGPEFLTIFDGKTGAALATTDYIPARHPSNPLNPSEAELREIWGDGNGNRMDRFLACVAYLDGTNPSLVMCRGYYTRTVLAAWDWRGGKLTKRWVFDEPSGKPYAGQGNHQVSVADVDGDGKDEIVYGAMVVDDDGKGLHTTGWGHGDALHVGDLDPRQPGIEVFSIQERFGAEGMNFRNGRTGKPYWTVPSLKPETGRGDKGEGPGRGVAFNIDPNHVGAESWAAGAGMTGMYSAGGERISETRPRSCAFAIWWDGDLLRELLNRTTISKWNPADGSETSLLEAGAECQSVNGSKGTPSLSGDLFGDWREEVLFPTRDGRELRIYTTTIPTKHRLFTLMHDPQYRVAIAWQNVAYNQPPHPSFYLDEKAPLPPAPKITLTEGAAPR